MTHDYSPEYTARKALDARVRDAQRVRVWTDAFAAVLPECGRRYKDVADACALAREYADASVLQFDDAWNGTKTP